MWVFIFIQSVNLLETCHLKSEEEEMESRRLLISLNLNLALCCLRLSHSPRAITFSRKVLNLDRNNAKALFRLGQVHLLYFLFIYLFFNDNLVECIHYFSIFSYCLLTVNNIYLFNVFKVIDIPEIVQTIVHLCVVITIHSFALVKCIKSKK